MKINMVKKGSFYAKKKKTHPKSASLSGVNVTRAIALSSKYDLNTNIYSRHLHFLQNVNDLSCTYIYRRYRPLLESL